MKHFLVVVHASKIQNYLAFTIQNLAQQEGSQVWLTIDSTSKPINPHKFSKLELFVTKKNPIFRKDALDEMDIDQIIKENKNVQWRNKSDTNKVDWIVLEDSTITISKYDEMTKNGFVALQFSNHHVIQQALKKSTLSITYLFKSFSELDWNSFHKQVAVENGLKNNCDKILWNFSVFLPSILFQKFNIEQSEGVFIEKKNRISTKIAILCNQFNLLVIIIKRKIRAKQYNWKIAFEKEGKLIFLKQPPKSYWADPFFIERDGYKVIFFEELDEHNKGRLVAATLNDHFEIIKKKIIIEEEFHLSFPNIFIENQQLFMIPESQASNKVLVYQCDVFPFQWSLKQTIVDNIRLIDVVWTKQADTNWVFANKIEDFEYDNNERLNLYSTTDLISGNWKSHPQNPIVCSKESARNAGKIINDNGKLIRVGQNGKITYGSNLVFNEIEILSSTVYKEKSFKKTDPKRPFYGQHTWNEAFDEYMVTDYLFKE